MASNRVVSTRAVPTRFVSVTLVPGVAEAESAAALSSKEKLVASVARGSLGVEGSAGVAASMNKVKIMPAA